MEKGEWVRTKNGIIAKVISNIYEYKDGYKQDFDNDILNDWYNDEEIINHSKNIIDLVQENDYINGYVVKNMNGNLFTEEGIIEDLAINGKIKSIVTREMMKSVEYKVE